MVQTSLTQQVIEVLGARIIGGELRPGAVLGLEPLAQEFDVSRPVVREAVKVLESHQLVRSRRRVGIQVRPETDWNALSPFVLRCRLAGPQRAEQLVSISQLRRGVEPLAAALASVNATAAQRHALAAAAMGMTTTGIALGDVKPDLEAYLEYDKDFHRTLLIASANPLMASLAYIVEEVLSARTHHRLMPAIPNPDAVRWHREVADAVAVGDAARAEDRMRRIVDEAQGAAIELAAAQDPQ